MTYPYLITPYNPAGDITITGNCVNRSFIVRKILDNNKTYHYQVLRSYNLLYENNISYEAILTHEKNDVDEKYLRDIVQKEDYYYAKFLYFANQEQAEKIVPIIRAHDSYKFRQKHCLGVTIYTISRGLDCSKSWTRSELRLF